VYEQMKDAERVLTQAFMERLRRDSATTRSEYRSPASSAR